MARRGYKLQEFIAHTSRVNCLKIGTKSSRLLLTGGEDHKVNLWEIGRPKSLQSLSGHTSPVESVTFDSAEVLAVSGASSGAIKLWDLEQAKILRTITGHRTNCTSVEFHPFGEFFASGSLDTDLKIWDIRRKGCIHTYKGHSQGIYTIRFTPDGRWVVSGGKDNVVKLWDLTAGKLLHDFKFHEGQIRCIDFHPHEFLLATGSEDRTVKFWDLETFELIGSTAPEATGVRSITFHPDGRTLFCGLEESFKVLSWEPIRYHDSVEMGWSTLEGLSIHEGKLLGCSYHQSCVGVWVADISLIAPYAVGVLPKHLESKFNVEESQVVQKLGSNMKSTMTPQTASNGFGTKEMAGGLSTNSIEGTRSNPRRIEVAHPSKELHLSSIPSSFRSSNPSRPARSAVGEVHTGSNTQVTSKLGVAPVLFRSNSLKLERASDSRTEAVTPEATLPGVAFSKPIHLRNPSNITEEMEHLFASDSKSFSSSNNAVVVGRSFSSRFMAPEESCETTERNQTIRSVAEKFKKILSPEPPIISSLSGTDSLHSGEGINSIRYIKGVAVQPGRTRSLVERWENREKCNSSEALVDMMSENDVLPPLMNGHNQPSERDMASPENNMIESLMQNHDEFLGVLQSRLTKLQVVRHFWERNDIKGSINAVGRLPDHAVQADVVSVLIEKIDIVTLDLFSCLLPLLTGLLDSKVDRFMIISLEMLLKLVKIFWSVINTTVSAFSSVGVDLHAEQRLERCNQCFVQLQKVKHILPSLIRRGGLLAKSAMELNLALQES